MARILVDDAFLDLDADPIEYRRELEPGSELGAPGGTIRVKALIVEQEKKGGARTPWVYRTWARGVLVFASFRERPPREDGTVLMTGRLERYDNPSPQRRTTDAFRRRSAIRRAASSAVVVRTSTTDR